VGSLISFAQDVTEVVENKTEIAWGGVLGLWSSEFGGLEKAQEIAWNIGKLLMPCDLMIPRPISS